MRRRRMTAPTAGDRDRLDVELVQLKHALWAVLTALIVILLLSVVAAMRYEHGADAAQVIRASTGVIGTLVG